MSGRCNLIDYIYLKIDVNEEKAKERENCATAGTGPKRVSGSLPASLLHHSGLIRRQLVNLSSFFTSLT